VLLPTSGSTGSPKYARISRAALVASATGIADVLALGPGERGLANLPLHYSYGLSVLVSHLVGGGAVVLTGHSAIRPEHWDVVRDQRVTSLPGVPYSYQLYDRVGVLDLALPHLRSMTQAGGRLDADTVRRYHAGLAAAGRRFHVMYGQTEATSRMSVLDPDDLPEHAGAVGRPVPGGSFRIDDLGDGVGEVVYSGPNVMLGYAHGRADLARPDELGGVLATGDVGRLDGDGRLWLTGRLKRIVKLYGERVSLDDIEQLARPWGPAVAAETGPDRLAVYVEGDVPEGAARTLERRLGVPPRTVEVVGVDELPRTASGKVDYARLAGG
jgi:acyl-CoA synthetase (AMP-forming)/AMP-acid ligase II